MEEVDGRFDAARLPRSWTDVRSQDQHTTAYLVQGGKPGRKAAQAEEHGVKVLDEAAFLRLVGVGGAE